MYTLEKGSYIVATLNLDEIIFKNFITEKLAYRDYNTSIGYYPNVLIIYEPIISPLGIHFVNKLGSVVSFLKFGENFTENQIFEFYNNYDTEKDKTNTHQRLKLELKNTFGYEKEPDTISNVSIDLFKEEKIKYDYYRIYSEKFQFLLESLFIFQLCKSLETNLMNFNPKNISTYKNISIFEQVKGLVNIENPRYFLISDNERKIIQLYYEEWDLENRIKNLKESFLLSTYNLNFIDSYKEKRQRETLNLFLIALTFISLIEVVPILSQLYKFDSNKLMIFIIFSILFVVFLIYNKQMKNLIDHLYHYFKMKRISKKIITNRITSTNIM